MTQPTSHAMLSILHKHTYNVFRQQKKELLELISVMPEELESQHKQIVKVMALLEDNIRNENN